MSFGGDALMYQGQPDPLPRNWNDSYRLEVFNDKRAEHRWRVRSAINGKVVANCGQGYSNFSDMMAVASKLFPEAEAQRV